jgi:hypothetical protein
MASILARRAAATALIALGLATPAPAADRGPDTRVYELRTYYAEPGKLDALHARFRDHTCRLFEKHGMVNVGYWVPLDNPHNELVYLLAFPDEETRKRAWKAFAADPAWQKARRESEVGGRLVAKVESLLLAATDYSPRIKPSAADDRIFELRVYTACNDNLGRLNARFQDDTCRLFERHGMTNVGYWVPRRGQKGAGKTLIYMLAHKSVEAAKASFEAFRKDPDWVAARKRSEAQAGGPLTVKDGVKSTFLRATDYSPIR